MKRAMMVLLAVLLALIPLCAGAVADIDLTDLSEEELLDLRDRIDERLEEVSRVDYAYTDAETTIEAMIACGAPIDLDYVVVYDEYTDPNGLLGQEGGYVAKAKFGCVGYKQPRDGDYIGGDIEIFANEVQAINRYEYINSVYEIMPSVREHEMYQKGNIVFRISRALSQKELLAFTQAIEAMDIPGRVSGDLGDEPTAAPSDVPAVTATPAPSTAATPEAKEYHTLRKGMVGDPDIVMMQTRLRELKYLSDIADGNFGGNTERAVTQFQEKNGLTSDGVATAETQRALFSPDALDVSGNRAGEFTYDGDVCPVQITEIKIKKSYGTPYIQMKVQNVGALTVEAFSYEIEALDAYGDIITRYSDGNYTGTYGKSISSTKSVTVSTRDNSGGSMYGYEEMTIARVAITRVKLSDGTEYKYSWDDYIWYEGK